MCTVTIQTLLRFFCSENYRVPELNYCYCYYYYTRLAASFPVQPG